MGEGRLLRYARNDDEENARNDDEGNARNDGEENARNDAARDTVIASAAKQSMKLSLPQRGNGLRRDVFHRTQPRNAGVPRCLRVTRTRP